MTNKSENLSNPQHNPPESKASSSGDQGLIDIFNNPNLPISDQPLTQSPESNNPAVASDDLGSISSVTSFQKFTSTTPEYPQTYRAYCDEKMCYLIEPVKPISTSEDRVRVATEMNMRRFESITYLKEERIKEIRRYLERRISNLKELYETMQNMGILDEKSARMNIERAEEKALTIEALCETRSGVEMAEAQLLELEQCMPETLLENLISTMREREAQRQQATQEAVSPAESHPDNREEERKRILQAKALRRKQNLELAHGARVGGRVLVRKDIKKPKKNRQTD